MLAYPKAADDSVLSLSNFFSEVSRLPPFDKGIALEHTRLTVKRWTLFMQDWLSADKVKDFKCEYRLWYESKVVQRHQFRVTFQCDNLHSSVVSPWATTSLVVVENADPLLDTAREVKLTAFKVHDYYFILIIPL